MFETILKKLRPATVVTETAEPVEENTHKVFLTTILDIQPHSGADKLELATVYGFQVIVKKGQYAVGDRIIYVPIDSLLPEWLETKLFPFESKVKLHGSRVRQIKLRGLASQGMLISPADVAEKVNTDYLPLEQNLAAALDITKYEPPFVGVSQNMGKSKQRDKKWAHPLFHQYNGLEHLKFFPNLFAETDAVVIQEKLHGTNARASLLPFIPNTLMKRIRKFLRVAPAIEKCYGSNKVDISSATEYKGFYGEDLYGACFDKLGVFEKLRLGEIVYGEIIGPGIQKNYDYGLTEHRFVLFDVKVIQDAGNFKWMNPDEVEAYAKERGFEYVPVLYKGPYNKALAQDLTKGNSAYESKQKVREGVVIKASNEYDSNGNKKALKLISEDYLADASNTDNH